MRLFIKLIVHVQVRSTKGTKKKYQQLGEMGHLSHFI